jgi:hypothetical protein
MSLAKVRRIHGRTRRHHVFPVAGAAALTLGATCAQARPVIPGAAGFGMDTVAGRGGKVYRVTNLNARRRRFTQGLRLRWQRAARLRVRGIRHHPLTTDLMIRYPTSPIAGQTAPSPGIMIRGAAIRIQASNILVQHIRVRPATIRLARIRTTATRSSSKAPTPAGDERGHRSLLVQLGDRRESRASGDRTTTSRSPNNIFCGRAQRVDHRDANGNYVKHGFRRICWGRAPHGRPCDHGGGT